VSSTHADTARKIASNRITAFGSALLRRSARCCTLGHFQPFDCDRKMGDNLELTRAKSSSHLPESPPVIAFIPETFVPPRDHETPLLSLQVLSDHNAVQDYECVMACADDIRGVFGPDRSYSVGTLRTRVRISPTQTANPASRYPTWSSVIRCWGRVGSASSFCRNVPMYTRKYCGRLL
jgi:hypothetical protein